MGRLSNTRWILANGFRYLPTARWRRAAPDDEKRQAALTKLMEVYAQRPDLQKVYPEAAGGGLPRLINWPAGVSYF